jgi:hypothetical protein
VVVSSRGSTPRASASAARRGGDGTRRLSVDDVVPPLCRGCAGPTPALSLPSCDVAEMFWLSVPARGQLDSQGCMNEAVDCHRVGPVGSPLQRERNKLPRLDGADGGPSGWRSQRAPWRGTE